MCIFRDELCMCQISITHGPNQFISSVEVDWQGLMCTLDFGDLGVSFKVTQVENVYFGYGLFVGHISITLGWNPLIFVVEVRWDSLLCT